jgi:hypothetical protein
MLLPASLLAQVNRTAEAVRRRRRQTAQNRLRRRVRKSAKCPEVAGERDSLLSELQDYAQSVSERLRASATATGEEKPSSEPASETLSVPYKEKSVFKIARDGEGTNT